MRSDGGDHRSASARSSPFFDDREGPVFNDVFGGRPKYTNSNTNNKASTMMNDFDYDFIFKSGNDSKNNNSKTSSIFAILVKETRTGSFAAPVQKSDAETRTNQFWFPHRCGNQNVLVSAPIGNQNWFPVRTAFQQFELETSSPIFVYRTAVRTAGKYLCILKFGFVDGEEDGDLLMELWGWC
nr:auxilin-related protein 2-like [Ipomoea batatas]